MTGLMRKSRAESALRWRTLSRLKVRRYDDLAHSILVKPREAKNSGGQGFIDRRYMKALFNEPLDTYRLRLRGEQLDRPQFIGTHLIDLVQRKTGALGERPALNATRSHRGFFFCLCPAILINSSGVKFRSITFRNATAYRGSAAMRRLSSSTGARVS